MELMFSTYELITSYIYTLYVRFYFYLKRLYFTIYDMKM